MIRIFWIIFPFLLVSCGPMNEKPDDLIQTSTSLGRSGNSNLSKNSEFYIYTSLSQSKPVLGDNDVILRVVRASTLEFLSSQAKVTVVTRMPDMPEMGESEEKVTRQSDGSFSSTFFFSMNGRWQIVVKIQDDRLQDEYTFEINL